MEQGIIRLTDYCNDGGCKFATEMLAGIHSLSKSLNHAISSDRNTLSNSAIELVNALLVGLGPSFRPLASLFIPSLLGLCARTNKVFTGPAKDCIFAIVRSTRSPSLLPSIAESLKHKSASVRSVAAECILAYLTCLKPPEIMDDTHARLVEDVIKLTARDASARVRRTGKIVFETYKRLLPDNVESFISSLSPTTRRHLAVQVAAVAQSTSRVLSCTHPTPLHAQNITSSKVSGRPTHPLSLERTRDVRSAKPIAGSSPVTSARQGGLGRPSGPTNKPKKVTRVSITQRPQRVRDMQPRNDEPRVRRVPAPVPKTDCAEITQSIRKTSPSSVKLTLVSSPLTLNPKVIVEAGSISVVNRGVDTSTLAEDVKSLVFDATALPYNLRVNVSGSKVPKKSLSSTQEGCVYTPSHVRRDASCPVDCTQRAPRRLRRVSTCIERSQLSRNSIAVTPSSCNRPIRRLLSCIQSGLPFSSPVQDMIIPRDASHPSCTNVDPQGESIWRARGAAFAVFKDPDPEVVSSDVAIEECSLFMADDLPAASQLSPGSPNATIAPHSDSPAVRSSLDPPSTTTVHHPRRRSVVVPRLWCRGRRPSEFKFLPMLPLSPVREAAPVSITTVDHLREVADFLDIAFEDIML